MSNVGVHWALAGLCTLMPRCSASSESARANHQSAPRNTATTQPRQCSNPRNNRSFQMNWSVKKAPLCYDAIKLKISRSIPMRIIVVIQSEYTVDDQAERLCYTKLGAHAHLISPVTLLVRRGCVACMTANVISALEAAQSVIACFETTMTSIAKSLEDASCIISL